MTFVFVAFEFIVGGRYGVGTPLSWLYDMCQKLIGGTPYPDRRGKIPKGGKTPSRRLDLQAGELVRVRSLPEILETIDEDLRNRGMGFHSEMVPFTGKTYRVLRRIEKIVHEKTGKMIHLKNDVRHSRGGRLPGASTSTTAAGSARAASTSTSGRSGWSVSGRRGEPRWGHAASRASGGESARPRAPGA